MNKKIFKKILMIGLIVGLTSCAINLDAPHSYQLTAVNEKSANIKPVSETLLISMPLATSGYQDNSMIYLKKDYTINAFVKNVWDVPPAEMLQPLITQSLKNTGYFYAVVSAPSPIRADLRLDTNLIKLQQNFTTKPSTIEMSIDAVLINSMSFDVIATHHFSVHLITQTDDPYGGVVAANQACQQIMDELSNWTVKETSLYRKNK